MAGIAIDFVKNSVVWTDSNTFCEIARFLSDATVLGEIVGIENGVNTNNDTNKKI